MVRKFVVTKVPLQKPLTDKIPKFGEFKEETDDLFLELLEVTKKLKPGVQTVFIKKPKIKPPEPVQAPPKSPPKKASQSASKTSTSSKASKSKESSGAAASSEEASADEEESVAEASSGGSLDSLKESKSASSAASEDSGEASENSESAKSSVSESPKKKEEKEPKIEVPVDPYEGMTPEEKEREQKKEYLYRWLIIRKKYPNKSFPRFTELDDLQEMKKAYELTLMELKVDDSYGKYRTYLIGSFFVIEYILSLMTDEIKGFCAFQTQAEVMETYDSLLVELGEKNQDSWFSKLPVEIRLFGYMCFQAGLFMLSKFMARRGAQSLTHFAYTALGIKKTPQVDIPTPTQQTSQAAPTMRGPSVTAEQLRQMQKTKTQ